MAELLAIGTRVTLADQLEGWFPLAPIGGLRGTIAAVVEWKPRGLIQKLFRRGSREPFYVVRLDSPLEVQEPASDTPSRLRRKYYGAAVICSRWIGVPLGSERDVSVHLRLLAAGSPFPETVKECHELPVRAWACCNLEVWGQSVA
jgi:hypothetical protein